MGRRVPARAKSAVLGSAAGLVALWGVLDVLDGLMAFMDGLDRGAQSRRRSAALAPPGPYPSGPQDRRWGQQPDETREASGQEPRHVRSIPCLPENGRVGRASQDSARIPRRSPLAVTQACTGAARAAYSERNRLVPEDSCIRGRPTPHRRRNLRLFVGRPSGAGEPGREVTLMWVPKAIMVCCLVAVLLVPLGALFPGRSLPGVI